MDRLLARMGIHGNRRLVYRTFLQKWEALRSNFVFHCQVVPRVRLPTEPVDVWMLVFRLQKGVF